MRTVLSSLVLSAVLAGSAFAQAPLFLKVDIINKSCKDADGPTEVHVRVPVSAAKAFLAMAADNDIKLNGKHKKLKLDQLSQLLETAKAGDFLLELTTDKGDLVKIAVQ